MTTRLLLTLCCFTAEPPATVAVLRAQYAYAHETRPALPSSFASGLNWSFDREALLAAAAAPQRELIVYSQPFERCAACRALYNAVGEGAAGLKLVWVKSNLPAWVRATPTIYDPLRHQYRTGVTSLDELQRWTGGNSAAAAELPTIVGAVDGRETLDAALEAVQRLLGDVNTLRLATGRSMPLGNVELVLPSPTVLHWDFRGPVKQATFEGAQPVLRAWGVQVTCAGVRYDGETLTVQIPRFPDWKLRVNR